MQDVLLFTKAFMSTTRRRKSVCFFASENSTEDQQNKVFSHVMSQRRSVSGRSNEGNFLKLCKVFQSYCCFFNCVTFNIQDWYAVNLLENVLKVYWKRSGFLRTEAGVTVGNICQHNFSQAWTAFSKKKKRMVLRKLQKLLHKLIISVFLADFST